MLVVWLGTSEWPEWAIKNSSRSGPRLSRCSGQELHRDDLQAVTLATCPVPSIKAAVPSACSMSTCKLDGSDQEQRRFFAESHVGTVAA